MKGVDKLSIYGSENIGNIFSYFHDGIITHAFMDGSDLILDIEIRYLAARINPLYRKFSVRLEGTRDLHFTTWPNDSKTEPEVITNVSIIFKPELDILQGSTNDEQICVICNQTSPTFCYCGGELSFHAISAHVIDEGGRKYSIAEISSLCKGYWDEWSKKNGM